MNKFKYDEKFQYPTCVCLNVTDSCNLACKYCFVQQQPHYMSLELAKKAVDFVLKNLYTKRNKNLPNSQEPANITFFGGEPTLMWDEIIVPIVLYGEKKYGKDLTFDITTNGTLLNEERINFLVQHKISILLSIDGIKEVQDKNRPCKNGQSSFDLIEPNLSLIVEKLPNTTFRMTLNQDTCNFLFDSYIYAIEQGFSSIFFCPNAREKWTEENLNILKNEIDKIYLFNLGLFIENKNMPIASGQIDNSFKKILLRDLQIYNNDYEILSPHRDKMRCGLGTTSISIAYDGNLYACQEQDSRGEDSFFYIGNIEKGIDKEKHIKILKLYDQEQEMKCEDKNLCQSCLLRTTCIDDACPSASYDLFKNFLIRPKVDCLLNQWMSNDAIFLMDVLKQEKNSTFELYLNNIFYPYLKKGEK